MTRGLGRWAGDKVLAVWLAFEDIHTFQNLLESSYSLQITFFKQALVFFVRCSSAFCFSRPWVGRVDEIRIGLPWGSAWPLQRCSGLAGVVGRRKRRFQQGWRAVVAVESLSRFRVVDGSECC